MNAPDRSTVDGFFAGQDRSRRIFDAVADAVSSIGPHAVRVGKSQVAFRRRRNLALAWMPDEYLGPGHAPLVLTVPLRRRDPSPRWKEVIEPYPGRFTHHLELYAPHEVDGEVRGWLHEAWEDAG